MLSDANPTEPSRAHVRGLALIASTALVSLTCAIMIIVSRVAEMEEYAVTQSINISMQELERPSPRAPSAAARNDGVTINANAPATPTDIPISNEALAEVLACQSALSSENCPREPPSSFAQSGDDIRAAPRNPTPPENPRPPQVALAGVSPPCWVGLHYDDFQVSYCRRVGRAPPPPTRSAEEVCVTGGIGPCTTTPFDPNSVVRLAHTE